MRTTSKKNIQLLKALEKKINANIKKPQDNGDIQDNKPKK